MTRWLLQVAMDHQTDRPSSAKTNGNASFGRGHGRSATTTGTVGKLRGRRAWRSEVGQPHSAPREAGEFCRWALLSPDRSKPAPAYAQCQWRKTHWRFLKRDGKGLLTKAEKPVGTPCAFVGRILGLLARSSSMAHVKEIPGQLRTLAEPREPEPPRQRPAPIRWGRSHHVAAYAASSRWRIVSCYSSPSNW
jgi:hypothetical protein